MAAHFVMLSRARSHLFRAIWQRIQADDCFDLAAQISYFFSLSLLPFCLVLAVVVGWLPSTYLWKSFATWIVTYMPRGSQHLMFSTILGLVHYSAGFLSLGLITALWSASSGFVSLMESLSVVYCGRDSRSYLRKHVIATCVTVLAMLFALASFGLVAFSHWGADWFSSQIGRLQISPGEWAVGRWIGAIIVMSLAVDLANFFLPDGKRRWHWLTPGTAFVVLTLAASSAGFNVYVQHFSSYPRVYGALGGFIILMLWIYIASLIMLVGAETDRAIEQRPADVRAG